jgi:hypothetical protein
VWIIYGVPARFQHTAQKSKVERGSHLGVLGLCRREVVDLEVGPAAQRVEEQREAAHGIVKVEEDGDEGGADLRS